ncbi:MAG TPA: thioredoxin family protein [Thermoplasmata archaeon]|nr:thioredoxin family protein [Thermoplasmata archaeon]
MRPIDRIDLREFDGVRLNRPGTWAVAFLADWCPFCDEFAPRFAALSDAVPHLAIADLTSTENPLWDRFAIEVVPTVLVFRGGEVVARTDGRAGEGIDNAGIDRIRSAAGDRSADPAHSAPHAPPAGT